MLNYIKVEDIAIGHQLPRFTTIDDTPRPEPF